MRKKWCKNTQHVQYSPKIMHAQEVVQEVLALQEHASGEKKLHCTLSAEVSNVRRSKSYPQGAARSYKSYSKPQILVRSLQ